MEKEVRRHKKINLVLAISGGESISEWAKQNGVSERTAFYWAKDPKVRREVEAFRRRVVNQAIGRLTGMTTKAVDGITKLAREADSESVQLRAWRAILADMMSVSKFSDLEYRMAEIEEQLDKQTGHTRPAH
jgi:transposase-like protein